MLPRRFLHDDHYRMLGMLTNVSHEVLPRDWAQFSPRRRDGSDAGSADRAAFTSDINDRWETVPVELIGVYRRR